MPQRLRIFVSSPGDVPDERLRADLVIDKLAQDYRRYFSIESYRWEHEPMLASGHFQDAIEPPSASDIVLLILWSRLGTPLPEKTAAREYHGLDGRAPVTGTEWEYEDALAAARVRGAPDILVFRNVSPAPIDPRDPGARARSLAQLDALDAFWKRHFSDRGIFIAASTEYSTIEQFAAALEESLRKLIERRIKAAEAQEGGAAADSGPTWLGNPFRGLQAYEFEHAAIFFGRDALVAKAAEQLAMQARAGTAFLLVAGASGSGKSSLVKAAVVPRLMKPQRIEGRAFLRRLVFRPGDAPHDLILGFLDALTQGPAPDGVGLPELLAPGQKADDLASLLRTSLDKPDFVFASALARITEAGRAAKLLLPHEQANLIVVVDQFEELFTAGAISAEERQSFVRLLAGLARSGVVWVIATMRADFWHRILDVPELVGLTEASGRLDLPPPSPAEVAEMIRKPAQAAGLRFETHQDTGLGLDTVLAEHAAFEHGVLPLLSFTLDALYADDVRTRGLRALTFATYEKLGGLDGAIATRADEVVSALPDAARAALPHVLRALVTVGEAGDDSPVARSVPLESFPPGSDARAVVDALVAARLLVASSKGDTAIVRVAHEALIGRWERARQQLAADRRDLETRALIEHQHARWREATGRARDQLLLRDPDLANALDLERRWSVELGPQLADFIARSHQRSRRRHQLAFAAAAVFGLVALAASGFGVLALRAQKQADAERTRAVQAETAAVTQRDEAVRQRNAALVSQSRYLAKAADDLVKAGTVRGAIALLRAALPDPEHGNDRPLVTEAVASAYDALYANRERGRMEMPAGATAVATDGAGETIVIAGAQQIFVRHGLAAAGQRLLAHDFGPPARIVLAPGGERLALIAADGTVAVRDLADNKEVLRHAGEGSGTRAYFMHGADLLLVTGADQQTWHLIDVRTGHELAKRRLGAKSIGASLVDAGRDLLVLIADDRVHRLSLTDLSDAATAALDHAQQFAMALAPDGGAIYLAAAKDLLDGKIVVLDSQTLAAERTFGKVTGGAMFMAISPDGTVMAVHGLIGLDFFDIPSGERLYRILASRDGARGQFLSKSDYIAYGANGFVRRYSPDLGIERAAYMTIDGGSIEAIDVLADGSGFLTVSDRPSITNWAFDAQGISRQFTVPLVIAGKDMGAPSPIEAFAIAERRGEVVAAYSTDHSIRRWNLETGAAQLVHAGAAKGEPAALLASLASGAVIMARKSGRLQIYAQAGDKGAATPAAEIDAEPWAYLGELDATKAFAVSKAGAPAILDVADPAHPKLTPVPALKTCTRQVAISGLGLCLGADDALRMVRPDGQVALDWPPGAAKFSSAFVAEDGALIALSYANGDLDVRTIPDGRTLAHLKLTIKLSGALLKSAAQSPLLSDADREKIRRGAKELEVGIGANSLVVTKDGTQLAAAMPDHTIKLVDLKTGAMREVDAPNHGLAQWISFSPNGEELAAVTRADFEALEVYDVASGKRIADISLSGQAAPKLARLPSGHGFATVDTSGRIVTHPVFQDPRDLIAYLARRFPEGLTPAQRRAYFID